jgi:transposase
MRIAPVFQVSVSYIYKALGRRRATGETTARRGRVDRKPKLAGHDEALRAQVAGHPDATIEELRAWLLAERKVQVSVGCLWNRLRFLGLTLKKSHSEPPNRIGRTSPRLVKIGMRAGRTEPGTPGLHRRNGCKHQHGTPLWPLPAR